MAELRRQDGVGARALEFAILIAARSGEVFGATWDEIDPDAKIWTIPGARMKAGQEHRIPLPTRAHAILGWSAQTSLRDGLSAAIAQPTAAGVDVD